MTRTLFVTNDFPPRRGGIETWVRAAVRRAAADAGGGAHRVDAGRRRSTTPPCRSRSSATRPRPCCPTPAAHGRVVDTLRGHGCDRVVFGASAPLGLHGARAAAGRRSAPPALTHGHEVWWAAVPGTRQLLRRIGDEVDELTYVSDYCRDADRRRCRRATRQRMTSLSPGGRPQPLPSRVRGRRRTPAAWGIADDALVVVCVARLVRRKGQDTLVRIWPDVLPRHPGSRAAPGRGRT